MTIEERVPLSRFTTLGTGGPARWFARPKRPRTSSQALAWAAEREAAVSVVGLGSNLLVADEGVEALVLKLSSELRRQAEGEVLRPGGAPLAVCLHRARAASLGGFEFACAIWVAGGGVWMDAGAYGGNITGVLDGAVADASGSSWRTPQELGLEYRRSALRPGEGRRGDGVSPAAEAGRGDQGGGRRDAGDAQGSATDEQADVRCLQGPEHEVVGGADAQGTA